MKQLTITAIFSALLWAFSLPGHAAVIWDGADYEGPRPVTDQRGASTTGIIWKCGRPGCPGYRKASMDIPDFGYPWQDWFPRKKQ